MEFDALMLLACTAVKDSASYKDTRPKKNNDEKLKMNEEVLKKIGTRPLEESVKLYIDIFSSKNLKEFRITRKRYEKEFGNLLSYRSFKQWYTWVVTCAIENVFDVGALVGVDKLLEVARQMEYHLNQKRLYVDTMRRSGTIASWANGQSGSNVQQKMARAWKKKTESLSPHTILQLDFKEMTAQ